MTDTRIAELEVEVKKLREACLGVSASLVATIWLLRNGGKKAAASDRMFNISLADYQLSLDVARAALYPQGGE